MRQYMRRFLVFTILLALFLTVFTPLALSAAYDGMVEVKYEETSVNNVFKMVIYAKSNLGVKAIDVILSYDNTVVVPVKRADNTPLTILDEGKNKEPVKIVALDANGDIYSSPQALWKVHGTRTASRIGAFIDDSSLVVLTNELMPVYEIYYTFQTGKSTADFSKSTFRVESAWGTSADDSFLMDFFNASPGDLASEAPFDRAGLAILRSDDTRIYWKQVNGTLSQIDVTYTYPNSLVATLGSITLQTAGSKTSIDIPANSATVPNSLQVTAQTFDTEGDPYTLLSPGMWSLTSAPANVTLAPSETNNLQANLIVPPGSGVGTAKVTFASGTVSNTLDVAIQSSASILTRYEFYKDSALLGVGSTDVLSTPANLPDLEQAYQVKVYDQYDMIMSPTVDWSTSSGSGAVTYTVDSLDSTKVTVKVANGAIPGSYNLVAKVGTFTAIQAIKIVRPLADFVTVNDISPKTYTGTAIELTTTGDSPELILTDGESQLVLGTDFTVEYSDNIAVGTATLSITGIGGYSGTLNRTFTINPKSLTDADVTVDPIGNETYTGSALTPSPAVKNTTLGQTLIVGTDYTVEYSDNIAVGTATLSITGIGGYSGTLNRTFTINPKSLTDADVTVDPIGNETYTGASFTPSPAVKNTTLGQTLVVGTDYTVAYAGNTNAGTATVTITGKDNYTGELKPTFTITPLPITVTADAKTIEFGQADPVFTYTVTPSLVSGDAFTGALSRVTGTSSGTYAINQGTLDAGTNYTITFVPANLTINPEPEPELPPKPPVVVPTEPTPVTVDGEEEPVATIETTEEEDGTTQTTITTNEDLTTAIQESTTQGTTVSLAFTEPATTYTSVLTAKTVEAMEEKEAILEVKTETATYTLPAVELNVQSISDQIGSEVALEDIKISVTISEPPADTVQVIQDTANANNYTLVVQPVQFQVTATYEDQEVEISKFTGYVERMIAIPDGVDPSKITTAVVLNEDGTFSHVPTVIVEIEGKFFAKINSLTNSTYTVIYNEKTFADTQGHWAEEEIIDMGSRLIVSGTGNDNYEPDREITRAEFATIVVRALGLRAGSGTSQFPDVTNNSWYAGFIQTAVEYGLINGYETGNFGPNDAITREQAMTIIARAMNQTKLNTSFSSDQIALTLEAFTDGSTTAEYAKAAITACIQNGIISGRTATTIEPKAMISRAEVAVIVRRLLVNSNLI